MGAFERLLEQIDGFIRKYYKNQMIRGLIWFVGIFLLTALVVAGLEYVGRFNSLTRGILFFTFIALNGFVLVKFIIVPLMRLNAFGERINRYQASEIIGRFFPNISDRLLNTLQLNDNLNGQEGNLELIRASVAQRSSTLSAVPFGSAIDLKENLRYLKYVVPVVLIFLGVIVFVPDLLSEGSKRVVNYNQVFVPEAPFTFELADYSREVVEGDDIALTLEVKGNDLPEKVYLISPQGKMLMKRTGRNQFTGDIKKVMENGSFHFVGNEFASKEFKYTILGRPTIGKFEATIHYPKYLGKQDEVVNNAGDLTVPEGATISWSVVARNTEYVQIQIGDSTRTFKEEGFKFSKQFKESTDVAVRIRGKMMNTVDSSAFRLNVIKDAFPVIVVEEQKDSVASGLRFFSGSVRDDYGLTSLQFVYTVKSKGGKTRTERMSVRSVNGTELPFDFAVDFIREKLSLEDEVEYYFVVTDNDGVNGHKSTRSRTFVYQLPSLDELNEKRSEEQEQAKADLQNLLRRTEDFQKNLSKLRKDLLNSKSSDWNKKNQVQQMQEEYNSLLQSIEKTQMMMEQSAEEKYQLTEEDQELMEKQELLNELMDELMDDELRKLLEELEKLMEQNNQQQLQEKLDNIELSTEEMNKQLDRSLEALKKMQVDEKIDGIEEELKGLAEQQEQLKKDLEQKKMSADEGEKKQEELNNKFEEIRDDLNELEKLNEELNRPMDLPDQSDSEEKVSDNMQDAKEQLSKGKESKAGQSQKSAADEMKQMAEDLNAAQEQSNQEQQEEDMDMLRDILESLVSLSLDQEWVMNKFGQVDINDPAYRNYGRFQRSIIDNTLPVRDSLLELAKRQPKIASFVDAELHTIAVNHDLSMEDVDERKTRDLGLHQQLAMTSFNNLALMLNESLQQMQQQMQAMMQGKGSCSKPGGKGSPKSGPSMSTGNMKEMLKKQLEQMQKGMSPNGKKPGDQQGSKPGESGEGGMGPFGNKEIAKMAAEQSAIRRRLEEMKRELNKDGRGTGNQLNPLLNELEKQEEDLVNKRFTPEMIKRQKEIMTRLLESEKALMERGFEEKRESKTGKNDNYGNQIRFDEYNKQKLKQIELLRSIDPVYNKYYKDKANQYFNSENE